MKISQERDFARISKISPDRSFQGLAQRQFTQLLSAMHHQWLDNRWLSFFLWLRTWDLRPRIMDCRDAVIPTGPRSFLFTSNVFSGGKSLFFILPHGDSIGVQLPRSQIVTWTVLVSLKSQLWFATILYLPKIQAQILLRDMFILTKELMCELLLLRWRSW